MKFNVSTRRIKGTCASRRMRRSGLVPATFYGNKIDSVNIELNHNVIHHFLLKKESNELLVQLEFAQRGNKIESKIENALIRSVQWHPYKPKILHVDFQRVSDDQFLNTKVPLHFSKSKSDTFNKTPEFKMRYILTELEISCLPNDLPKSIKVDVSCSVSGEKIHLSDINLPKWVRYSGGDENPLLALSLPNTDYLPN